VTGQLVALDLPGGPRFVDALRDVWDRGDAACPLDQRLPGPAKAALLSAMEPASAIDASGRETTLGSGRPVEPDDALVVATSGSTGTPRGVVLTHDAVAASARATSARLGTSVDDHWLACLPLSHVGGLSVVTRAMIMGTALTVLPAFDVAAVEGSGASLVALVATALARVDTTRFRVILVGGAAAPPTRPANVVTTYGLTETGSGVVYDGRPLDAVEVRIDGDGEIHVRGPMLLRAYRDGHHPLRDGWLATGDLGRWRADGRLHVEGRRGQLIITGGENVWPEPVEAVVAGMTAVADVAVAGLSDPEWGQVVVAFVVPNGEPPTLDAVRNYVKEQLAPFAAPRRLVLVDAIPRTALGKIRRGALAALAERAGAS
jgi:O-succinylbenzoic acid--CoA ligase